MERLNRPLRTRREAEVVFWARKQPVVYETRGFVRTRRPANTWANWNHHLGGGPRLVVREQSVEVSAPQGMMLESRTIVFSAKTATMWLDRVGWAGLPFGRKDCILIRVPRGRHWIEVAITPVEGLADAWQALQRVGVQVKETHA